MTEELTEITLINPRPKKSTSLWMNLFTLVLLFGLIVGVKYLTERWLAKTPPPEDQEHQIVLEDLQNETPIAESPAMEMPKEGAVKAAEPAHQQATTDQKKSRSSLVTRRSKRQKQKITKHEQRATSPYAQPDPFTNGGPLDLDRAENRPAKGASKTFVATPGPVNPPDARDQFIPFESD